MDIDKEKQYDRLIKARNYHYDNLNKWLMTFYAIIGALFIAFYKLYPHGIAILIAILGYVISIGTLFSIKGYFYWEVNWIMLVHHFEKVNYKKKDDRVYSVFANIKTNNSLCPTDGSNISTTKVALAITAFIAIIWGMISFYYGINLLDKLEVAIPSKPTIAFWSFIASTFVTFVIIATGSSIKFLQSDMQNLTNMGLTKENMAQPQGEERNEQQ